MTVMTPEGASESIESVTSLLAMWYANKGADSMQLQGMARRDFTNAGNTLTKLIYGVQPEQRVVLAVARTPVDAVVPVKGAHDCYYFMHHQLAPKSSLVLERPEEYVGPDERELYIGGRYMVSLSSLAMSLAERSQLIIVDQTQAQAVRPQHVRQGVPLAR